MTYNSSIIFVLFGATGDLAQKKIMPALMALFTTKSIADTSTIIAFSRRPWGNAEYRDFIKPSLMVKGFTELQVDQFLNHVVYVQGNFDEGKAYDNLKERIQKLNSTNDRSVIFHLAVQPEFYKPIVSGLHTANITQSAKVIVEKPFGQNYKDAEQLELVLEEGLTKDQIYRIDHYLGKQGLIKFIHDRQNDKKLDSKLHGNLISSVSIRIIEHLDIQGRGEFYEPVGAIRDIGQNHALQMLAVIAMDIQEDDSQIPIARAKILSELIPIEAESVAKMVVRGQYNGYKTEQDVSPESTTETYFKIEALLNNSRWDKIPFIIEGGKAMNRKITEIVVHFKDGTEKKWDMEYSRTEEKRDAYEIILEKAIEGDKTYFVSIDEVLASWRFVDSILKHVQKVPLTLYEKGSTKI